MFDEDMLDDINDRLNTPLTMVELRQRLKHIASLCWGLSIDLQNEFDYRNRLVSENNRLTSENSNLLEENKKLTAIVYNRKHAGRPKKTLSPEEVELRRIKVREANRRAYKKRKLRQLTAVKEL